MKTKKIICLSMAWLAAFGICLPQVVLAVEPTPPVEDVALAEGGVLHGKVVDLQGGGVGGVSGSVKSQNREVVRTTTNTDGSFAVKGLNDGVYQLSASDGQGVYRLWSAKKAPPVARNGAIVYTQGNCNGDNCGGCGGLKMLLANPIVIAGLVATAIAVPVALANSHHASP